MYTRTSTIDHKCATVHDALISGEALQNAS